MENLKKTVLYQRHIEAGANMAPFGGYEMPLWYKTGVKAEHMGVLEKAGIFDTSHMAAVRVSGSGARNLLQVCISKDLERTAGGKPLAIGRCVYGVILTERGTVLDDAIVYMLAEEEYLVVVNAGMGAKIASHFETQNSGHVTILDLTDKLGKMDIQGPHAAHVMQKILEEPLKTLQDMVYFSFKGGCGQFAGPGAVRTLNGTSLMVSRTGYTGEFGFEIFCDVNDLPDIWDAVVAAGGEYGLVSCGLAARDSLRAGAVLPLSHQDIGDWPFLNNPWEFALPLLEEGPGFSKSFVGSQSLKESEWKEYTLPFAGFDPRKINAGEKSSVVDASGREVGIILTCTTDMAIDRVDGEITGTAVNPELRPKGLSCGFVRLTEPCLAGDKVFLTDGKRKIPVEIRNDIRPGRTARVAMARMLAE